jgi:glutaredoxin 3
MVSLKAVLLAWVPRNAIASRGPNQLFSLQECRDALEQIELPIISALDNFPLQLSEASCPSRENWREIVSSYDHDFVSHLTDACSLYIDERDDVSMTAEHLKELLEMSGARTRLGVDVATAKFAADPAPFRQFAESGNTDGIMGILTNVEVEKKVIERVAGKAAKYASSTNIAAETFVATVTGFYKRVLIPVTKSLEVSVIQSLATTPTMTPTEAVAAEIANNNVVVFSKSYCPFCRRTKELLNSLGVPFSSIELDERPGGADLQAALHALTGQRTVPSVFVKGTHIGGNDDTHRAHKSGYLLKLLENS